MKIDRHRESIHPNRVKLRRRVAICSAVAASVLLVICIIVGIAARFSPNEQSRIAANKPASPPVSRPVKASITNRPSAQSETQAVNLLHAVLEMVVHGPAFDAKVRETVWTTGRGVVGVGTYEQAGGGSGRYNLQVTMHDGDGKHRLQQISDGRLAWTRAEIAGKVSLRRVDVGRLDEWVNEATSSTKISPRLRVGGWAEMLSTIERDYVLRVVGASLKNDPVWVITGQLREDRRKQIMEVSERDQWPASYPTQVRVAVRAKPDPETLFGAWLPARIEFWSDPIPSTTGSDTVEQSEGRMISLVELYSVRPITPPPEQRFRFENHDDEVNFTNETDRYFELYGVPLTERQRRQLRR
jgi:hypothetical protein